MMGTPDSDVYSCHIQTQFSTVLADSIARQAVITVTEHNLAAIAVAVSCDVGLCSPTIGCMHIC